MRERDIEAHLVKRVKALGGEVRKVQWIGRRGAPDRRIMVPAITRPLIDGLGCVRYGRKPITAWVELKATGVKPEGYQLREHTRMRDMGELVYVIDSIEGVEALLR